MLAYALAFYACYFVAILGLVPMVPAGFIGVVCLLRYFNRAHEMIHADERGETRGHPSRTLLIIMGPIYLGYRELRESHLLHHREEGSPRDPDHLLLQKSPITSFFWSLLQAELSVVDWVQRFGLRPRVAAGIAARAAVWSALMWLGGWPGFVLYNVMVRVGNGGAMFVFSWVVHGPWLWGQVRPPRFPMLLARVWVLLINWENLVGIRFHFLHHVFPHIPDRHLPEVSRRMIV
jgi:fatty acid desaturase